MAEHLAFPLKIARQGLATVDQDSDADIVQSVSLLLTTRPGERRSAPEYGLPDPVFSGAQLGDITAVVAEWEPRADMKKIALEDLAGGDGLFSTAADGTFSTAPKLGVDYGSTYSLDSPLAADEHDGTYTIGD